MRGTSLSSVKRQRQTNSDRDSSMLPFYLCANAAHNNLERDSLDSNLDFTILNSAIAQGEASHVEQEGGCSLLGGSKNQKPMCER